MYLANCLGPGYRDSARKFPTFLEVSRSASNGLSRNNKKDLNSLKMVHESHCSRPELGRFRKNNNRSTEEIRSSKPTRQRLAFAKRLFQGQALDHRAVLSLAAGYRNKQKLRLSHSRTRNYLRSKKKSA